MLIGPKCRRRWHRPDRQCGVPIRDGFRTEADHRRRHPWRHEQVRRQPAVAEVGNLIVRNAKRKGLVIGEGAGGFGVVHQHVGLARHAGHGLSLDLIAVHRIRLRGAVRAGARDADAEQHGVERRVRVGRPPAAILEMAAGAGSRVEQRPEAVAAGDRRGRDHPIEVEKGVAHEERWTMFLMEIARRQRKRVARAVEHVCPRRTTRRAARTAWRWTPPTRRA